MNKKVTKELIKNNLQLFSPSSLLTINHYLKEKEESAIVVINTRVGLPTFKYQGILAHSKYNPLKEGENKWESRNYQKEKSVFYLLGDFLYEIEAWVEKCKKNNASHSVQLKTVTLYLCFPLFSLFLSLIKNRNLHFLKNFKSVNVYFPKNINFFLLDLEKIKERNFFIVNDNKNYAKTNFLFVILNLLNQKRKQIIRQETTEFNFKIRWLKNTIKNIYHTTNSYPFACLVNGFLKEKAIIIGAGLSLYSHFNEVITKKKAGYKIIIADTCLPAFLRRKIVPDFIIALDGGYYNTLDFKEIIEHQKKLLTTALITNFILYPSVLNNFSGPKYFFHFLDKNSTNENLVKEIFSHSSIKGNDFTFTSAINAGSSVATVMVEIAVKMGFEKISILGLDFKGFFFQNHLPESMHWDFYYNKTNRINPITHQEFLEVIHSLDQEEKIGLTKSKNYQTCGANLKKYHEEFLTTLANYPKVQWENFSFSVIPKNSSYIQPLAKDSHPKKIIKKRIFNNQTRNLFIQNNKKLINKLKKKIIPFLQNPQEKNLKIIEEFFKKNISLQESFLLSKEFSESFLKTKKEERGKKIHLLFKKISIIEHNLKGIEKRITQEQLH